MFMKALQLSLQEVDQKCLKPGGSMMVVMTTKHRVITRGKQKQVLLIISQYMPLRILMMPLEMVEKHILKLNFLILVGLNLLEHPQILLVEQIQPGVI